MTPSRLRHPRSVALAAVLIAGVASTPAAHAANGASPASGDGARIIGGTYSTQTRGTVYIKIAFEKGKSIFCGSTLIAPEWLLTAKHCFDPHDELGAARFEEAYYDQVDVNTPDPAKTIKADPNFKPATTADLMIFKLAAPVPSTPVKLATQDPQPRTKALAMGWGYEDQSGPGKKKLKEAEISVGDLTSKDNGGGPGIKFNRGNGIPWQGDSGGPTFVGDEQVGVASYANSGHTYVVYGSVARNRAWIKQIAGV